MQYNAHGASCCGISHVSSFDYATVVDLDRVLRDHDMGNAHGTPGNRMLEAVLTDRQLDRDNRDYNDRVTPSVREAGGWAVVLAARGFVLHTRFRNSNSQKFCNVFHRILTREPLTDLAFTTDAGPVRAADPAPPAIPAADIPEDWRDRRGDIIEFHTGEAMHIVTYDHGRDAISLRFVARAGETHLIGGMPIHRGDVANYRLSDGRYIGNAASAGSIRVTRRPAEAAPAVPAAVDAVPVPAAPVAAPAGAQQDTPWSTQTLDTATPYVGLRVQYRATGLGATAAWDNLTGFVTSIARLHEGRISVRLGEQTQPINVRTTRFVWNTRQMAETAPPLPVDIVEAAVAELARPAPAPVQRRPVITRDTQYFAVRRGGERVGPFQSEGEARRRWSRVGQYVRIDTVTTDGVIVPHETVIAA